MQETKTHLKNKGITTYGKWAEFDSRIRGGVVKKNELIDRITREARLRRSEAIRAVKAVVGSIRATISEGGKISLSGLGTFKVKSRKARPGRNPKTGETIQIPVGRKISFKPSLALKKLVKTSRLAA